MNTFRNTVLFVSILFIQSSYAQMSTKADDSSYYDSWPGKWYQVIDGKVGKEPRFVVSQGLYRTAYEEIWIQEGYIAKAWRGWDSRTKKWDFAWVTDDGLFQIWEGKKVDGIWYMYKTFIVNGENVLSRQAFIMENDQTLIRTSEHSKDKGKTWRLRFREKYVKGK